MLLDSEIPTMVVRPDPHRKISLLKFVPNAHPLGLFFVSPKYPSISLMVLAKKDVGNFENFKVVVT